MNETLTILTHMDWPTSMALIGMTAAVAIGAGIRTVAKTAQTNKEQDVEIKRVEAARDIQIVTAKNQTTQLPAPASRTQEFEG